MTTISDLKPNDTVVVNKADGVLVGDIVIKVTDKMIVTAAGRKFNRRNGKEWGESNSYHSCEKIQTRYSSWQVMEWEEAREINKKVAEEKERKAIAAKLENFRYRNLPIETLRKIQELIEVAA